MGRSRRLVQLLTATAVAVGTLLATPGVALAQAPYTDDERATPYSGNNKGSDHDPCATLEGDLLFDSEENETDVVTFSIEGNYLDITDVKDGVVVTGVIVKGGNGYNVYPVEELGELDWLNLRSPFNNGNQQAAISHWNVCGTIDDTDPSETQSEEPSETQSEEPSETQSEEPSETQSEEPSTSVTTTSETTTGVTTTTSVAPVPVADEEELASTGANVGWLIMLSAGLLLAGGALLAIPQVRAKLSRIRG